MNEDNELYLQSDELDVLCVETVENYEWQSEFQTNCWANIECNEAGVLEFQFQPYITCISHHHEIRERHFTTRIQQRHSHS